MMQNELSTKETVPQINKVKILWLKAYACIKYINNLMKKLNIKSR